MADHSHLDTIRRYYQGCNTADGALMRSTFTSDVVHYFTHHDPVRGADALAQYWESMQPRINATWTLDHGIVQGAEAVIEWSMSWTPPGSGEREMIRGAEWYEFEDDLIREIRAYYFNPRAPYPQNDFELLEFPYEDCDYADK